MCRKTNTLARTLWALLCLSLLLLCRTPASAQAEAQPWTEAPATRTITAEEASALTGVPADRLLVLWSTDYSTEQYPAVATVSLPGLDGLPAYAFAYIDGAWALAAEGSAPLLQVPVTQDGPLSVAISKDRPTVEAPQAEASAPGWLPAAAAVAVWGLAAVLVLLGRRNV